MKTGILLNTDQISCFDESGNEIDCRNTGQDGNFNTCREAEGERFTIGEDVAVDTWTGLSWPRNANLPEFPLTWNEASEFIREMNDSGVFGIYDWRLPARDELFSFISHQCINPALPDNHPFVNVFNGYYWTCTQCARLPNQAWYVHLGGGRVYRGMKHGSYLVWPVAGRESKPRSGEERFLVDQDCFYDRMTEITWAFRIGELSGPLTWQEATQAINEVNGRKMGGHSDWRLPNIRELESLVDLTRHSPAVALEIPDIRLQEGYWSSTTSVYEPRYAWVLYIQDGAVGVGYKSQPDFYVSAVR